MLYDRYIQCRDTIGNHPSLDEILAEMALRDSQWLNKGVSPHPDYSRLTATERQKLKPYEVATWNCLAAEHGIVATLLPEKSDAPANIDALVRGKLWELKNPKDGKHAIEDRIRDGASKWTKLKLPDRPRIVLSNSESSRSDESALDEAIRRCRWYGVGELLFVSHDGARLRRVTFTT